VYNHVLIANDLAVLLTIPIGAVAYAKIMAYIGGIREEDVRVLPMSDKISRFLFRKPS